MKTPCPYKIFTVLLITILFLSGCNKDDFDGLPVDGDGNVYETVVIGTQTWMKENLKTTRYNDGRDIPHLDDYSYWRRNLGGYCLYDNDPENKHIYGALYNIQVVRVEALCPVGWHLPTSDEWTTLINYLGGEEEAVVKLKEQGDVHWTYHDGGTNESGFTALPAGERHRNGTFGCIEMHTRFWASSPSDDNSLYCVTISNRFLGVEKWNHDAVGYSVRCIKD